MISPRDALAALPDYAVGDLTDYGIRIRAHRNESPVPPPQHVVDAVRSMDPRALQRYPAELQRRFAKRLAGRLNTTPSNLVLANGADEILLGLARCLLDPGDSIVTVTPTFGMFARAAAAVGARVKTLRYSERWKFDPSAFVKLIDARTKLIYLCHPNNPTGDALDPEALEFIARSAKDTVIAVDEIYLSFRAGSLIRHAGSPSNVAVIGSFSKVGALAGLRVGYLVAHPLIARLARRVIAPYPFSAASLIAADAYLSNQRDTAAFEAAYDTTVATSLSIYEGVLVALGATVWRGPANFLLADVGFPARPLVKAMRRRGIGIRSFDDPQLIQCIRVSATDARSSGAIVAALGELVPKLRREAVAYA